MQSIVIRVKSSSWKDVSDVKEIFSLPTSAAKVISKCETKTCQEELQFRIYQMHLRMR